MLSPVQSWPPPYHLVIQERADRMVEVEQNLSGLLPGMMAWYGSRGAAGAIQFIEDWCMTYDPRNAGTGRPTTMPFVLFKRQRELVEFLFECLNNDANGLIEKCRDMGATWVAAAFSVWLFIFWPGVATGWGSRKEALVDKLGDPDSIFEKMRIIIRYLPGWMKPRGFSDDNMTYMRFVNPETGATITGESGDNIGRGGRKRIYFKDESAHYERPELIEAALGDNTRVQIDISSVKGLGTVFNRRREAGVDWEPGMRMERGKVYVFVLDWRDHPEKTQTWYDERRAKAESEGLLAIFAQEVDRNYSASVEGVVIPAEWVQSAIDAHVKLGWTITGKHCAGLDVADGGGDTNALAVRKGILLHNVEEWGARDVGQTTRRAIGRCASLLPIDIQYDSIGDGAGVKSEATRLRDDDLLPLGMELVPWSAAASVLRPRARLEEDDLNAPRNEDYFKNLKAQAWWELRRRFERTHRAVTEKNYSYDPDMVISIASNIPSLRKLVKELSQVTMNSNNSKMKMVVDKAPDGAKSPNLADAVVMAFWPLPVSSGNALFVSTFQTHG